MFQHLKESHRVQSSAVDSLPPISPRLCSCDAHGGKFIDRHVQDIERSIYEEMKELNGRFYDSKKDRFMVFKKSFEMVIEESVSFKPLLSEINKEYLGIIRTVENGEYQRNYIERDLKFVAGEKGTLDNYEKRTADLQSKAEMIRDNNKQLKEKIERLRKENQKLDREVSKDKSPQDLLKVSRTLLPGLEMEEQTNIQTLSAALSKLKASVSAAREDVDSKFQTKEKKLLLQKEMQKKETIQRHVSRYNTELKERFGRLNIAVEVY